MTIDSFLSLLGATLGTSVKLTPDMRLIDISEFDSMGQVSIRAMADEQFGKIITEDEIIRCVTARDLHSLLVRSTL